jgi:hypothetical protein
MARLIEGNWRTPEEREQMHPARTATASAPNG